MRALVFGIDPGSVPEVDGAGNGDNALLGGLAATPMDLIEVEDPKPIGPDWLVLRSRLTGICGSDSKQVFMENAEDEIDNAMTALISFPQVLGHELVATVEEVGPDADGVDPGQRVVLNPWLSCGPRGIDPPCPACQAGDLSLCWSFTEGRLSAGIHTGNAKEATGGFAELVPAHRSMVIPVPDGIADEVAVLADPFAVSLHAVTRTPPPPGGKAVVYGAGALGTTTTGILRSLYPDVEVATVARWPGQAEMARNLGAAVFEPEPRLELVEALARWSGGSLRTPWQGLPWCHPGQVDVVYDTVGKPETLEVGIRVLKGRGSLVVTGVGAPGRFEWAPLYFKEIRVVGSNAFGVEEVDGRRQHGIAHYLDLVEQGRVDVSAMLTHTFPLDEWRQAFSTLARQGETGAIKVAFDQRQP
ncbi:MAG: alcohol dehydrogenase catalytic domain-containing protein [Acidimicrobiia bacterium]|nr:alcohol dehydrogenase catalytic domain-containing protein [Acidimicrobiia bacterium]